jgi:hypothetical protein
MMFAKIVEDRRSGLRWMEIPLSTDVDDGDDRALIAYLRRFCECRRAPSTACG